MKLNTQVSWKFVSGIVLGVLLTLAVVLTFSPPPLSQKALNREAGFLLGFQTQQDTSVFMTPGGEPTRYFKELVSRTSGTGVNILIVTGMWHVAKPRYGNDSSIENQWKALGLESVRDFDQVEWPQVVFAKIPWLKTIYSRPDVLKCADGLRQGEPWKSDAHIWNEKLFKNRLSQLPAPDSFVSN